MIEIIPHKMKQHCEVTVPGSKSITHRTMIAAALSNGICYVENALRSEDSRIQERTDDRQSPFSFRYFWNSQFNPARKAEQRPDTLSAFQSGDEIQSLPDHVFGNSHVATVRVVHKVVLDTSRIERVHKVDRLLDRYGTIIIGVND